MAAISSNSTNLEKIESTDEGTQESQPNQANIQPIQIDHFPVIILKNILSKLPCSDRASTSLLQISRSIFYRSVYGCSLEDVTKIPQIKGGDLSTKSTKDFWFNLHTFIKPPYALIRQISEMFICGMESYFYQTHHILPKDFHSIFGQVFFKSRYSANADNLFYFDYAVHIASALGYRLKNPSQGLYAFVKTDFDLLDPHILKRHFENQKRTVLEIETCHHTSRNILDLSKVKLPLEKIYALPPHIGTLERVGKINLAGNCLSFLPTEIKGLKKLVHLNLSGNRLTKLPAEIGEAQNLTVLKLDSNQLTALPKEIGQLGYLTELYIASNKLKDLPSELGRLSSLQRLDLLDNKHLQTLPSDMTQLENLQILNVGSCTGLRRDRNLIELLQALKNKKTKCIILE